MEKQLRAKIKRNPWDLNKSPMEIVSNGLILVNGKALSIKSIDSYAQVFKGKGNLIKDYIRLAGNGAKNNVEFANNLNKLFKTNQFFA